MNTQQFYEHWSTLKPKIQNKWNKLTDEDMKAIDGNKQRFLTMMRSKYKLADHELDQELLRLSGPTVDHQGKEGAKTTGVTHPNRYKDRKDKRK